MTKLVYSTLIGVFIGILAISSPVLAQELKVVDNFSFKKANKKTIALKDFQDHKAVVVVFTSSHCSWALQYVDRLIEMHGEFDSSKVAFLAINSNDPTLSGRDSETRMAKIAKYPFPYLKDKDQSVAKLFEVSKTPEAFVLIPQKEEKNFLMVYRGKIDDNPVDASLVKKSFLKDAIQATLKGEKPEIESTMPNGCGIKWIEQ
jgi:peroxiredoxin